MPKMWFQGALEIANVVVSFKVFPTGIDVDLNELEKQIEKTFLRSRNTSGMVMTMSHTLLMCG